MWLRIFVILHLSFSFSFGKITDIDEGKLFLSTYNTAAELMSYKSVVASWNYNTNITEHNQQLSIQASLDLSSFLNEAAANASAFDWENFNDADVVREFSKVTDIGAAAFKDEDKLRQLNEVIQKMTTVYSTAQVCGKFDDPDPDNCLYLDPGLSSIMANSRDEGELRTAWKEWREESGKKMLEDYETFVDLSNEALRDAGYDDTGAYWRSWYESAAFEDDIENIWEQLKPLYLQLHAYVRMKLKVTYASDLFPESGHIPAHLLGNMWAQTWTNIYDIINPFPNKTGIDVTDAMVNQNYTIIQMYEVSDEFFKSIGMIEMPQEFWDHSMLEKPDDREVVCHASAWDFYNRRDFRIKQCTEVTMGQLITVHHEMGHIEYYLQYKDLPVVFRRGANPGFHEAVGDVISLSVSTPAHLKEIGLLDDFTDDVDMDIIFLLTQALSKIAFLPFGFMIDQWRWEVFNGKTTSENYNHFWWKSRCHYQGIYPPEQRSPTDFDPGAKFHIPANVPYIRYFTSYVMQFQFHKAMCDASGHVGPIHKCDIYNSTVAGKLLSDVLKLGSSMPWSEAMKMITGGEVMDAAALMDYFEPLTEWLKDQNEAAGETIGWNDECPNGPQYTEPHTEQTTNPTVTPVDSSPGSLSISYGLLVAALLAIK